MPSKKPRRPTPSPDELVAKLITDPASLTTEPLPLPEFDPGEYDPVWDNYISQISEQDLIKDHYLIDDDEENEEDPEEEP
jgi:hypothetical protein